MNRAQIDRQIRHEAAREGYLGLWLSSRLGKDKRALRKNREAQQRRHRLGGA